MEKRSGLITILVLLAVLAIAQTYNHELDSAGEVRAHIETMQHLQNESPAVLKPEQRHFPFDSLQALHTKKADSRVATALEYFKNYKEADIDEAPSIKFKGFGAIPRGIILLVLAAAVIVAIVFIRNSGNLGLRTNTTVTQGQAAVDFIAAPRYELLQKAVTAERNGELRLAIRYYYNHLLHQLNEAGIVNEAPGKTNYQYLSEISDSTQRKQLARLMLGFDLTWYGEYVPQPTQFESWKNDFRNFQETWKLA